MIVECFVPNDFLDAVWQWAGCRRHQLPVLLAEQLVWSALWLPVLPFLYVLGRQLRCRVRAPWVGRTRD